VKTDVQNTVYNSILKKTPITQQNRKQAKDLKRYFSKKDKLMTKKAHEKMFNITNH
jgi:hypothetical protein